MVGRCFRRPAIGYDVGVKDMPRRELLMMVIFGALCAIPVGFVIFGNLIASAMGYGPTDYGQ